jgi:DNA-binding beta-propeller fold protein YncE
MTEQVINEGASRKVPAFQIDPFWPKPLPNNWILGAVAGVAVDAQDHVWIIQRPRTLTPREAGAVQDPPLSECCVPAPSVIEFDPDGNVLRAWGGPDHADTQPWPGTEHGMYVDSDGNVWTTFMGADDHVVFKNSPDGERLLTLGQLGKGGDSNDTVLLGRPTDVCVDPAASEVYISDGYVNRRIIVFDSKTGAYKRHWGAYGERPDDSELQPYDPDASPIRSFRSPMHAVRIGHDDLVYTADRVNNRIQVFRKSGQFVKEAFHATRTLAMGSIWDLEFSPDQDQTYLYVPDGTNQKVWIMTRENLEVVGAFGRGGRMAGHFGWVHSLAVDSQGNIYTGEVETGKRVQKFLLQQ